MWYKREESQRRFSLFFGSATLAGAFGSLLASAIQTMDGTRGLSGWRWIFILEGLVTCILCCVAYFVIPNFPEDAKWLAEEEKIYMTKRLLTTDDSLAAPRGSLLRFFSSPRNWMGAVMYFGKLSSKSPEDCLTDILQVPQFRHMVMIFTLKPIIQPLTLLGLAYFTPTIVQGYGYGTIQTQLHSVPPSAAAWVLAVLLAILSDRYQLRSPFVFFSLSLALIGSAILLSVTDNTPLQYGSIFLVAMGTYSAMPLVICWYTMNLVGHWERGVGTGWMIGFGNIGAIVATFAFTKEDAPKYHKGYSILLTGVCIVIASSAVYLGLTWREKRKVAQARASGEETGGLVRSDATPHAYYL